MSERRPIGTIAELWRFPVKSMAGERLDAAALTEGGVVGDRAYALIDVETGKVASAKTVRLFSSLLDCTARFVSPPEPGRPPPPVRIALPDGSEVLSSDEAADAALSAFLGRRVRLAWSAPTDFIIDQYYPDVEGADPAGHRDVTVQQKLGAAFFAQAGLPSPVPEGAFPDLFPVSLITTSSLRRVAALAGEGAADTRRFRMNLVVETADEGFLENDWPGRPFSVGAEAGLTVAMPDPRCVMVTLAQGDLEKDTGLLETLVRHNRLPLPGNAMFPCLGVYAVVTAGAEVRVGDEVFLG